MTFRSKIDFWLLFVLLTSVIAALVGAAFSLQSGAGWVIPLFMTAIGAGLPMWILLTTKYTVSHDCLLVQSGPFRWRIAAESITDITPTRSPLSSPALSLDRLRIAYEQGTKYLIVSPLDSEGFIQAIGNAKNAA